MDPIHVPFYFDQGPDGGSMLFLVRVGGGAAGSNVAFRALVPNPDGPIELPPVTLTSPNLSAGIRRRVEAGYRSEILLTYWPSEPPGPGFDLGLDVFHEPTLETAAVQATADTDTVSQVEYDQGSEAGEMEFAVVVRNGTPGAEVSLVSSNSLPDGTVGILPTRISQPDFIVGTRAAVPAGWQSQLTATYAPFGTPVSPELEVAIQVLRRATLSDVPSSAIENSIPYVQGAVGGRMAFAIVVQNGAPGARVTFSAQTSNRGGSPIALPPTRVGNARFSAGIATDVDAGYETTIVYSYDPNGTPVSPDLSVSMQAFFIAGAGAGTNASRSGGRSVAEDPVDPRLVLNVALQNPMINNTAQVGVSFEIGAPVDNTLDLLIQNPFDQAVLDFVNDLPEGEPPPPLDEPYVGPRIDRLYVYFPYGSTQGTLTDPTLAASITLSPGPENATWDVVKQSSPSVGTNWILFPKLQAFLRPRESVAFRFTGIRSFNPAPSLTHMRMKKQVTGYEVETDTATQLSLIDAQPVITSFSVTPKDDVTAGTTVNFAWTTWGAKSCALNGQQGLASSVNAYPVFVLVSGTYRLDAFSASSKSSFDTLPVNVQPVKVRKFEAVPAAGSRIGEPVLLQWETSSAVTVDVQPDVGQVCSNAAGCNTGDRTIFPAARTVYTLTASGGTSTDKKSVTVFPLPRGWLKTTPAAPWSTTGKPVLLAFTDQLVFLAGGAAAIYTSVDGVLWRTVSTSAPWGARTFAGGAVFNGGGGDRMWVMGGQEGGNVSAEIYASTKADGTGWELVTNSPGWAPRSNAGCIVWKGKLWLIGGSNGQGGGFNDVWTSTNGKDWTRAVEGANWSPRWAFGLGIFKDRLWILGGQVGPNRGDVTNEVWSSVDGLQWKQEPAPGWNPRSYSNTQSFSDRLYLFGGARTETVAFDDLWRLTIEIKDGKEVMLWAQTSGVSMGNSAGMGCAMLAGGAWLAGGWSTPGIVPGPNKSVWLYAPVPL